MQQNIIMIVLVTFGLGFVYFKYMITPLNTKYAEGLKTLNQVENKLAEMKRRALELPRLQAEMQLLEEEVASLEKLLPKETEISGLLRLVTKTAQKYKLTVKTIVPATVVQQENLNEVPFQMTIQGTYHSLAYFLSDICQEDRILGVKNIILNSFMGDKNNPSSVNVTFILLAYTFRG